MACIVNEEIQKYVCREPSTPPPEEVYAPYVEMEMKNGTFRVNCGNDSIPIGSSVEPHKMVISSMQYAIQQANGGMKVEFELLGEGSIKP